MSQVLLLAALAWEFFKTGFFSVGGGLATLPFLYEISDKTSWFSHADIADMIAISESTPGALGINMSTYAGYLAAGIHGGVWATLSLVLPSVIIIVIIAHFLEKFRDSTLVKNAFYGLRPASIALITVAGINVAKTAILNIPAFQATHQIGDLLLWKQIVLGVGIFLANRKLKLHPIFSIIAAAIIGIVCKF